MFFWKQLNCLLYLDAISWIKKTEKRINEAWGDKGPERLLRFLHKILKKWFQLPNILHISLSNAVNRVRMHFRISFRYNSKQFINKRKPFFFCCLWAAIWNLLFDHGNIFHSGTSWAESDAALLFWFLSCLFLISGLQDRCLLGKASVLKVKGAETKN